MKLKGFLLPEKTVSFDVPGCPGFQVELTYLSRDEMQKLIKKCTKTKYDSKTRQPVENLDEDTFTEEYAKRTIKGWTGFKYKYAREFLLLEEGDLDEEIDFTEENVITMLKDSMSFEKWVADMTGNLENFTKSNSTEK